MTTRRIILTLSLIGAIFLGAAVQNSAYAQDEQEVEMLQIEETSGTVLKVDGQEVTVETDGGAKVFNIGPNVQISENGIGAEREDIKTGDRITVQHVGNEVLSASLISEEVTDAGKIGTPILVGLAILLLLAYLLARRGSKGHIKTTTDHKE